MGRSVNQKLTILKAGSFPPIAWLGIALALLPLPIKRTMLLGEPEVLHWLAWDYGVRFIMILGVVLVYEAGAMGPPPTRVFWQKAALIFVIAALGEWFLVFGEAILGDYLPSYFEYFAPPVIRDRYLLVLDLTLGIMLVAISEELVFRRLVFSLLERFGLGKISVLFFSSALFALVHITSGLDSLIVTFLHGLIFGAAFYSTGRLSVCIALHYIGNFLVFGVFPSTSS